MNNSCLIIIVFSITQGCWFSEDPSTTNSPALYLLMIQSCIPYVILLSISLLYTPHLVLTFGSNFDYISLRFKRYCLNS